MVLGLYDSGVDYIGRSIQPGLQSHQKVRLNRIWTSGLEVSWPSGLDATSNRGYPSLGKVVR